MEDQIAIQKQQEPSKTGKGKVILIGIGVLGLGTLAFFGWRKLKGGATKPEELNTQEQDLYFSAPPKTSQPKPTASATQRNDNFPLKRGSKGERVKAIQQVLVKKGLLDAKDVIGEFGPKTEAGLIKAGFPISISEESFIAITSGTQTQPAQVATSQPIDASALASGLYQAARARSYDAAMKLLKTMKSTADYVAVSEKFKTYFLNGVRQTLVNGMLNTFTSIDQKAEIKNAFLNMGLKYDGSKFSLSGLPNRGLITKQPTMVYDHTLCGINVPANMVLGTDAGRKGKYTQFKNNGRYFLVPTTNINYL